MALTRKLVARLASAVVTLIGMSLVIFVLMRATGNPIDVYLPLTATHHQQQQLAQSLGLNKPLVVQYFIFLLHAIRGDFGNSLYFGRPVIGLIAPALVEDVKLILASIVVALPIGVVLGTVAAARRSGIVRHGIDGVAIAAMSIPPFYLGVVLIIVFAQVWPVLPANGAAGWSSLVLPAVTLAAFPMAGWLRLTQNSMQGVLASEYTQFARLNGVPEHKVIWLYGLKNAGIPIASFAGLVIGPLIGGAVVVETVFGWPGLGQMAVTSITNHDYDLLQGIVIVLTAIVIFVNTLVDVVYLVLDPRLRHG